MADSRMGFAGKRMLVVDDDLALRVLLQAVLKRRGATVILASNGTEAIAKLRDRPDLVILDLLMPQATGFDVIEHLRAHDPALLARVLILTAASPKRTTAVQDVPILYKPFDADVLIAALEARLEERPYTPPPKTADVAKRRTGFATRPPEERRELARKGGRAAHQKGVAHTFTTTTARIAGRRGGEAVSRDREHMARIARKGAPAKEKPTPTLRAPEARSDDDTRLHNVRGAIGSLHNYLTILAVELPKALRATIQATARDAARADAVARALGEGNVSAVPELAVLLEWLDAARDSADTAHRIINLGTPTTVDVGDTIRRAVTLIAPRFAERGGVLQQNLRSAHTVTIDVGELIAVWVNLLNNALTAGACNAAIEAIDEEDRTRIDVRDDGAGIPPAVLPRLFEGTSTKPGGGTGLKYVHRVITTLGGTVTATSQPGETTFTIILPTIAAASPS